ncbi:MAG: hypothetical protein HC880_02355 [Bacteroidia bacterium]|nr:hypothetical protein [Bacteroidia bacterium]
MSAEGANFRTYKIGAVRKHSPAYDAGLMRGDQIIAVDTQGANTMSMNELYDSINKRKAEERICLSNEGTTFI